MLSRRQRVFGREAKKRKCPNGHHKKCVNRLGQYTNDEASTKHDYVNLVLPTLKGIRQKTDNRVEY